MFDYLHACEPGALINIGVHSHFGGRPAMAAVFRQLLVLVRETGMAALVATHNPDLAARMDRTVTLKDGVLSG